MTEVTADVPSMEVDTKVKAKAEKVSDSPETKDAQNGETTKTSESLNGEGTTTANAAVKTETTDAETSEGTKTADAAIKTEKPDTEFHLEDEIVQQIQYYFGDMNLRRDKFLQGQIKLDDGWVPLQVLLTFNRMKQLTMDTGVIAAALKKATKPLVEVSEDKTKVRRSPAFPLPEMNDEWQKSVTERTIYSKGFPTTGVSLDELIRFYKQFGEIDNVQKRTYFEKDTKQVIFKGSVFVTFKTTDDAAKYLALESVKFGDSELIRKAQQTYFDDKRKERDEKWGRKNKNKNEKSDKADEKKDNRLTEVSECPRGCILLLDGFPKENAIARESIRDKITELGGDVAYITYDRGNEQAYIRLQGDDKPAVKLLEALTDKKLTVDEAEVTASVLEGDEETAFLKKSLEDRDRRRFGSRRRGGKNFGGKNSFRGRKRHADNDSGPPSKKGASAD